MEWIAAQDISVNKASRSKCLDSEPAFRGCGIMNDQQDETKSRYDTSNAGQTVLVLWIPSSGRWDSDASV